jgi:hypothetical protein
MGEAVRAKLSGELDPTKHTAADMMRYLEYACRS